MKLYLIRHGETVDNIAGIYAGVKDSQLTNHGVEQTKKLGEHFASTGVVLTHIFASPLIRAHRTAEAVQNAQRNKASADSSWSVPDIIQVADLTEQDFGYYEGKPFYARSSPATTTKTGRTSHAEAHKRDADFVDVETKEAMSRRADDFLTTHLMPIVDDEIEPIVAIVSHGMLLSTLWRRILLRISRRTLSVSPEVTAARGSIILEHLGGWSNTGYLELSFQKQEPTEQVKADAARSAEVREFARTTFSGFSASIVAIDSKTHLVGMKRQRGGIGRLAHDESQQKLTSFFKRSRTSQD